MKIKNISAGLSVILASMAMPPASADAPQKCSWVRSDAIFGQPWDTGQGLCKVIIDGEHFDAVLYDEKNVDWARFKITGSLRGGQLTVKVETENSDAGLDDFTGKLKTSPTHEKVIVLSDGYNMIGIKLD